MVDAYVYVITLSTVHYFKISLSMLRENQKIFILKERKSDLCLRIHGGAHVTSLYDYANYEISIESEGGGKWGRSINVRLHAWNQTSRTVVAVSDVAMHFPCWLLIIGGLKRIAGAAVSTCTVRHFRGRRNAALPHHRKGQYFQQPPLILLAGSRKSQVASYFSTITLTFFSFLSLFFFLIFSLFFSFFSISFLSFNYQNSTSL